MREQAGLPVAIHLIGGPGGLARSRTTWARASTVPETVTGRDRARGWIATHVLPSGTTARVENTADAVTRLTASLPKDALGVFEGEARRRDRSRRPIRRRRATATAP
jgi:hypothetical protein